MYTLGINAALGEPSACLVRDGRIIAAAREEWFTGSRTCRGIAPFSPCEIPFNAIAFCLSEERVLLSDIDHIAYSFNPYLLLNEKTKAGLVTVQLEEGASASTWPRESEWEPIFLSSVASAQRQLCLGIPCRLRERFGSISAAGPFVWHFVDHHLAHAASAFFASPFATAAVITMDSGGEKASTTYSHGSASCLTSLGEVSLPNSLGRLFGQMTEYLGFQSPIEEPKVIELSAMGKPAFVQEFRRLVSLRDNGQYLTQKVPLEDIFGPARSPGEPLEKKHYDIASSFQVMLQETVLAITAWLKAETGEKNLCFTGSMALNPALNGFIRQHSPFSDIWVQPASDDGGTALGAALWIDNLERTPAGPRNPMEQADLGPYYAERSVESLLKHARLRFRRLDDIAGESARLLAEGRIIGWFQGRAEFGSGYPGWRSLVASPLQKAARKRLNSIKGREGFRPCGTAILADAVSEWFLDSRPSPFMMFSYPVRPEKARSIPACCHDDGTARVHTVERRLNPLFYDLIKAFGALTGVPVLLSSSLNLADRPTVCSPRDAIACFSTMPVDAMVIGHFILEKE
ncbi:MAG: carbamoyltransferase [Deltaproteobacteria bacterium]